MIDLGESATTKPKHRGSGSALNCLVRRFIAGKHWRAIKVLMAIIAFGFYFAWIPNYIVIYGMENSIPAFDNGAPHYEVYSVFLMAWAVGHVATAAVCFGLYQLCYGMWKDDA
jgi:hypothetical protein